MSTPQLRGSDPYEAGLALSAKGCHVEAIEQFERAHRLAPDDTRVLFALGNTARALGMSAAAEEFYGRVLAQEPLRLEALINLANLRRAGGKAREAVALLESCVGQLGDAPELWLALGGAYRDMGSTEDAEETFREALARRPDYAPALGNLADILADRGETDEALALYDRALKRDAKNPQLRLNRAILHLLSGRLKEGWRDYAGRLELPGKAPKTDHDLPRWNGGSLKHTRLLVTAEQGVGDHLLFASLFPELIERARAEGGSVVLECDPRLVALFARSFPQATVRAQQSKTIGTVTMAQYDWLAACGGATQATEMGSLPRFLRNDVEAFPASHSYLKADAAETARWRQAFAGAASGPFTGICWRSGKLTGARSLQYAPLEAWADFLRDLPGAIVSVQYDAAREEVEKLEALSGRQILMPEGIDQKNELDRTCALLCALDAVVSAPTAVSWLSAGAGVPTLKVLYDRSWTSFGLGYEPFAPAATCVRPAFPGDWVGAFAAARDLTRKYFSEA